MANVFTLQLLKTSNSTPKLHPERMLQILNVNSLSNTFKYSKSSQWPQYMNHSLLAGTRCMINVFSPKQTKIALYLKRCSSSPATVTSHLTNRRSGIWGKCQFFSLFRKINIFAILHINEHIFCNLFCNFDPKICTKPKIESRIYD